MKFTSMKGNLYYFHNNTGQIFFCSDLKDLDEKKKFYDSLAIYSDRIKTITSADIHSYLYNEGNGYRQLILEVTEACNLRCKYCIYSEHYPYTRSHGIASMSYDIMKYAIDHYFKEYAVIEKRNPMKKPVISFYGGEPLLRFGNIKKVVLYVRENYPNYKPLYNITTNGVLFMEEIQDFLHEHEFSILVSLDAYRENHDRNRISLNSNVTHERIINNLMLYNEKYGNGRLCISCCYDYKTNFEKLEYFFNELPFDVVSLTQVQSACSDYYDQFSSNDFKEFCECHERVKAKLFDMVSRRDIKKDSFAYKYFSAVYGNLAYHRMILEENPLIKPYTGTCVPGEKLFVNIDGSFKICEKVNHTFNIGSLETGLDFKRIAEYLENYNGAIQKYCGDCEISRLCQLCFKDIIIEGRKYINTDLCDKQRALMKQVLSEYITLLEDNPELFDDMTTDYYNKLERVGELI